MLVVIDTNILVNALLSRNESSKAIRLMDDVYSGTHRMCVSSAILAEYHDVLHRPQFHIPTDVCRSVLSWIEKNSLRIEPLPSISANVPMKDESDRIFFDVAKCLDARLITRNYKHYPVHELVTLIDELY